MPSAARGSMNWIIRNRVAAASTGYVANPNTLILVHHKRHKQSPQKGTNHKHIFCAFLWQVILQQSSVQPCVSFGADSVDVKQFFRHCTRLRFYIRIVDQLFNFDEGEVEISIVEVVDQNSRVRLVHQAVRVSDSGVDDDWKPAREIFSVLRRRRSQLGETTFDESDADVAGRAIRKTILADSTRGHQLSHSFVAALCEPEHVRVSSFTNNTREEIRHLFSQIPAVERTTVNECQATPQFQRRP